MMPHLRTNEGTPQRQTLDRGSLLLLPPNSSNSLPPPPPRKPLLLLSRKYSAGQWISFCLLLLRGVGDLFRSFSKSSTHKTPHLFLLSLLKCLLFTHTHLPTTSYNIRAASHSGSLPQAVRERDGRTTLFLPRGPFLKKGASSFTTALTHLHSG